MKNPKLIFSFITFNILIIFACIYQFSCLNQETYKNQRLEQKKDSLTQLKTKRQQELCAIKNPDAIKKYAKKAGMKPISIKQIETLENETNPTAA